MFVPNFKILGQVVAEKSLTKKKVYTHTHTEKAKTIYPLYTSYTGGIKTHLNFWPYDKTIILAKWYPSLGKE